MSHRDMSFRQRIAELEAAMAAMKGQMVMRDHVRSIETTQQEVSNAIGMLGEETHEAIKALQTELGELKAQVNLLVIAMGSASLSSREKSKRAKLPEPKRYEGARDAKELKNFLFDIEKYFRAVHIDSKKDKVLMAAMYLAENAKLWWHSKFTNGECLIKTWNELKQELKIQFFPENVEYIAHRKLRELSQTRIVREFMRDFSTLMLDIRDMSEKDKMFYFLKGLKPWARTELVRQNI